MQFVVSQPQRTQTATREDAWNCAGEAVEQKIQRLQVDQRREFDPGKLSAEIVVLEVNSHEIRAVAQGWWRQLPRQVVMVQTKHLEPLELTYGVWDLSI